MTYSDAYIQYLIQFHVTRDWFECHEIMEEEWKRETDIELKPTWHMLVKIAVAQYHERRGNDSGAMKLYAGFLEGVPKIKWNRISLHEEEVCAMVRSCLSRLEKRMNGEDMSDWEFTAMNLPIIDPALLEACGKACQDSGLAWIPNDGKVSESIVHRHKLRDRTDEYAARQVMRDQRSKRAGANN